MKERRLIRHNRADIGICASALDMMISQARSTAESIKCARIGITMAGAVQCIYGTMTEIFRLRHQPHARGESGMNAASLLGRPINK